MSCPFLVYAENTTSNSLSIEERLAKIDAKLGAREEDFPNALLKAKEELQSLLDIEGELKKAIHLRHLCLEVQVMRRRARCCGD